DTSGLSETDLATREGLQYVPESTTEGQNCTNCEQFTAGAEGECASCTLVPGPITDGGWCMSWQEKVS
ncbi:MAG: high-potential iron-sulfur protein, partial [Anaerolineae bacterium]